MQNVELFNQYVAEILGALLQSFPTPTTLNVGKMTGFDNQDEYGAWVDKAGNRVKQPEIFIETFRWLNAEGFVRCVESDNYAVRGAVLSAKGLDMLNKTPESLNESYGNRLTKLLRNGSLDLAKELTKKLIEGWVLS